MGDDKFIAREPEEIDHGRDGRQYEPRLPSSPQKNISPHGNDERDADFPQEHRRRKEKREEDKPGKRILFA
jgi:hypothetical protein